jgi:hypothetical protein
MGGGGKERRREGGKKLQVKSIRGENVKFLVETVLVARMIFP